MKHFLEYFRNLKHFLDYFQVFGFLERIPFDTNFSLSSNYSFNSRKIVENVSKNMPQNIFIWGTSGTGKTLILTQILGIKRSHYKTLPGMKLNIVITSFQSFDAKSQLLKNLKVNYLKHMNDMDEVRFLTLPEVCSGIC